MSVDNENFNEFQTINDRLDKPQGPIIRAYDTQNAQRCSSPFEFVRWGDLQDAQESGGFIAN